MSNKFLKMCRTTFLSCERYSWLASRRLDDRLTLKEKIQFWAHHSLCLVCRRFKRQIDLLDSATKKYQRSLASDSLEADDDIVLSPEATLPRETKEKIRDHLTRMK